LHRRRHRAQANDVFVSAAVAHHADGLHRQQYRKRLPDLVVEPGAANLVNMDAVGEPQDVELLARDLARLARRQLCSRCKVMLPSFQLHRRRCNPTCVSSGGASRPACTVCNRHYRRMKL
jgi:hypothetical protein